MQTALPPNGSRIPLSAALVARPALGRRAENAAAPRLGTTRRLGKNEELFAEGDRASFFYRVISGAVRTYKLLEDGRRQIDAFHLPGDILGVESREEHRFTAEALGEATVVVYRRRAPGVLAAGDDGLTEQVMAAVLRSLERAQDHMLLLGRKSALEKVASFLLDMGERVSDGESVELPMSRTDIADHLGLTIETVSRTLGELVKRGVIALPTHRRTVVLRDRAGLRHLGA